MLKNEHPVILDSVIFDSVTLQSGEVIPNAKMVYSCCGTLNDARDNVVVFPTCYMGTHADNEGYYGKGRAIDPARHFIISINMFGNGLSSSPSNTPPPFDGPRFPNITIHDNVACQHRLLTQELGITRVALVTGWSMAACQSFEWASQFPGMVDAVLPFFGSARTSPHNFVFLEGVKAALQADQDWSSGDYTDPPVRGLKAFARVYAGWGYSQTFYRAGLYRDLGYETVEELLLGWEQDHLAWDANDLLAMLWTWQNSDVSANTVYGGDLTRALDAMEARAVVMPCTDDLYFPPADSEIEVAQMRHGELRVFDSPWGHCAAVPGDVPAFDVFFDDAVKALLASSY